MSAALGDARDLVLTLGRGRADTADGAVDYTSVDDDVFDGICSPVDALLLA